MVKLFGVIHQLLGAHVVDLADLVEKQPLKKSVSIEDFHMTSS